MVLEITQPRLQTYENKPLFYTDDGVGVVFRAPVDGAHTPGSSYARCELRQTQANGDPAAWSNNSATHTMEIDQAITVLPSGPAALVAGQIHDDVDDITTLRLEGTNLWISRGDNPNNTLITSSYVLGTRFKVKWVAGPDGIRVSYNGVEKKHFKNLHVSGAYFKAGVYPQSTGSGYGEVVIYGLTITRT